MAKFEQCKQSLIEKTRVWEYFLREISGESAQCMICQKVLKTSGGSTSSTHKHMKSVHSIIINNVKRSVSENPAHTSSYSIQ